MVRFDKVVKRFGDHTVLDGLDLSVGRSERVTLVGPSGSGKTTVLRLLMTLERVTDGVIHVDGQPYSHMPAGRAAPWPRRTRSTCPRPGGESAWSSSSSTSFRT